jgi:hypothetical protein
MRMHVTVPTLVALLLGGCSGTQAPGLSVVSGSVREKNEKGAVLELIVEADNPNGDALPLEDVEYTVTRDGEVVFTGTRSAEVVLRRYGRQRFVLPASLAFTDGTSNLAGTYSITGSVVYQAPGAIQKTMFDEEIVRPSASFSGEVKVDG